MRSVFVYFVCTHTRLHAHTHTYILFILLTSTAPIFIRNIVSNSPAIVSNILWPFLGTTCAVLKLCRKQSSIKISHSIYSHDNFSVFLFFLVCISYVLCVCVYEYVMFEWDVKCVTHEILNREYIYDSSTHILHFFSSCYEIAQMP